MSRQFLCMQIENISIFTDTHFVVCHFSRFRISVNNEEKTVVAFNFFVLQGAGVRC